jgi:hypothetical protein
MHSEVLTEEQKKLLPLIGTFSDKFGLVGGTAIALQIGHRRSVDFDLFTQENFDADTIREEIRKVAKIETVFVENPNELTIAVDKVKMTFYKYPFEILFSDSFENVIKIPDLLTLGAMKVFALGKRAKWKDYVDLYFIFNQFSFRQIADKARGLFAGEFNEKLLREELSYFSDIDYSEQIEYLKGFETADGEIKKSLQEISLSQ